MSKDARQETVIQRVKNWFRFLDSYRIEEPRDGCAECGSSETAVAICDPDGVFRDYCRPCTHQILGIEGETTNQQASETKDND